MRILDLFAGIGGFSLAGHWAGHDTAAFVEKDPFCQQVLKKNFAGVPIYGDIKEFDGTKYEGAVDIICGGFPCQPFSVAGKRKGTDDDRHLWPEMLRVIREIKPTWVIGENVGGFLTIGEGLVFEQTCLDLEAEGYEVQAFVIPAIAVNAPHRRDRVWIVAHSSSSGAGNNDREIANKTRGACEDRGESFRQTYGSSCPSGTSPTNTNASPHSDIMRPQEQGDREQTDRVRQSDEIVANSIATRERGTKREKENEGNVVSSPDTDSKRARWDDDWIEVATELCRVDARLSDWLDRCMNDVIYLYHYENIRKNNGKDLSYLQEQISKKEIWEKIRGLFKIFEQEDLLSILRKLQRETQRQNNVPPESQEIQENGMRKLWDNAWFKLSSQRREYQKQCSKQLADIMPELPHETALEITEIWDYLSLAYSSSISPEVKLDGFELSKSGHRRERLKSLGNSIVPQVAYEIFKAINEASN